MDSEKNKFFYCNAAEIAVSPYDFSFKFIRNGSPEGAKEGAKVQPAKLDEFTVSMSPAHAKVLLSGYFRAILDYEKSVGPIAVEANSQDEFNRTFGLLIKK